MSRMREEVLQTKARLDLEMRERWTMDKKIKEDQARLATQEEALAAAEAKRVSSSSSSSSSSSASRGSSSTFSRGGSGSNVLWSQLPNQQRGPALLQCQHHLRSNPHRL